MAFLERLFRDSPLVVRVPLWAVWMIVFGAAAHFYLFLLADGLVALLGISFSTLIGWGWLALPLFLVVFRTVGVAVLAAVAIYAAHAVWAWPLWKAVLTGLPLLLPLVAVSYRRGLIGPRGD